jgi:stage II sporulation protein M
MKKENKKIKHHVIFNNFNKSFLFLKKIRNFLLFSLALFIIFTVLGYIFPVFFQKEIAEMVSNLVKQTEGLNTMGLIGFIFLNNLKSSFFAVVFGIIFGIIPFFIVVFNGYVLGFVANKAVSSEGSSVLFRLIPHGIFEIPAILISISLGFKLGMFIFGKHHNVKKEFVNEIFDLFRVFVFIVIPLLIIAAIIEGSLIYFFK